MATSTSSLAKAAKAELGVWERLPNDMIGFIFRFDHKQADLEIEHHFGQEFKNTHFFWLLKAYLTFQGDQKSELCIMSGKMDICLRQANDQPFTSKVVAVAISEDQVDDLFQITFEEGETQGTWQKCLPKHIKEN
jgi:hypothetical protein